MDEVTRGRLHELVDRLPEEQWEEAELELASLASPEEERAVLGRPMSERKRVRLEAAIEQAQRLQAELLAARGGVPFPNSWELIDEARHERLDSLP